MIRPLTVVTFLMACGSGLYLYQSKHEVQLLDRTIEKSVHETAALREQSRLLATEWNMLNDPERLRQFSDTYLMLKSINPAQYTSLGDLDAKLPAPRIEVAAPSSEEEPVSVGVVPQSEPEPAHAPVAEQGSLPVPPVQPTRPAPAVAAAARLPEVKVATSRPIGIEAPVRVQEQRTEQRALPRVAEVHPEVRTALAPPPRPIALAAPRPRSVVYTQSAPPRPAATAAAPVAPAPFTGSLLGMAHGSMPPAPRPTPINATYNSN